MTHPPFHNILHPTDFSPGDEGALAHALRLGLAEGAALTFLHVTNEHEEAHWSDFPPLRKRLEAWNYLPQNATHEDVRDTGIQLKKALRSDKAPVQGIANYLETHSCDLLVLATHQRTGWTRLWHPSKSEALARKTGAMTLFVPRATGGFVSPSTGEVSLQNVLVPVATHPSPFRAALAVENLGRLLSRSELHIDFLHVGDQASAPRPTINAPESWTIEHSVWAGDVTSHILETSRVQQSDLIVMATAGHCGVLDAIRGSTTEQVLEHAPCPVLAVPAV